MAKGRSSNGNGNIVTHKGRAKPYQIQYTMNGQRKSGGYFATMEEANKALRSITSGIDAGTHIEPSKMTLAAWSDIWLKEYTTDTKSSTLAQYESYFKNHINPILGKVKLSDIQPHDVQKLINHLQRASSGSKPLAYKTIKNIHGALSTCLKQAVTLKYIRDNPATGCKLPRKDTDTKPDMMPLDSDQIRIFQAAIKGHKYERFFLFLLNTGVRLSEAIGLMWSKVDFKTGKIKIDAQMGTIRRAGEQRTLTASKSRNVRVFIAPPSVLALLKDQQLDQMCLRLAAGPLWSNPDNLVFTTETGNSLPHRTVESAFESVVKSCGLEGHRLHDLRHTFAVEAIRAGVDYETISKHLGHADPGFTLRVYADVTDDMRKDAAEKLQRLFDLRDSGAI